MQFEKLFQLLAKGYPVLISGIGLTYFLVEVIAPKVLPFNNPTLSAPFFFLGFWLLGSAATRVLALTDEPVFAFAVERIYDFLAKTFSFWILSLVWTTSLVVIVGLSGYEAGAAEIPLTLYGGFGIFSLASLYLLARIWPLFAVSFLYRGRLYPPIAALPFWHWWGPGIKTAWRMTGRSGAFSSGTLAVLASWGMLGALRWAISALPPLPGGIANVALWAGGVPLATLIMLDRARLIRLETEEWVEAGPPEKRGHPMNLHKTPR